MSILFPKCIALSSDSESSTQKAGCTGIPAASGVRGGRWIPEGPWPSILAKWQASASVRDHVSKK